MKRILVILSVGVILVLAGGVAVVLVLANTPLGPSLELDVPPQVQARQLAAIQNAPQAQQKTCGNKGIMRLIVIGRASPITAGLYGADAIRLVAVDFDTPAAGILALPVALWVETPVLADLGFDHETLSMVYQLAWENTQGEPDHVRSRKATQALAQTIVDNFEFVTDHYVTVEETPFIEFIDQLDGIEVNLPEAVDGMSEGYGVFPAGVQLLSGIQALNLARLLHPSGQAEPDIWGSLQRQTIILQGMRDTVLRPENVGKVFDLAKASRKAVITDLSVNQAQDLACMVEEVGSQAHLLAVTPEMVSYDAEGHMIPDMEAIKMLLESLTE